MDTYSSGEDLIIKTRKPYTITKQRERWTEEEHNKFLEALKLYGRAWQRIEEHIGSKTAVQIRSHAQKFFTKLEKEALAKGVPVAQALDIDIPPPRPKRKPSNPYPRKTCLGTSSSELLSKDGKGSTVPYLSTNKHVVNMEKEPSPEKHGGDESTGNGDVSTNENDCSEVVNLFQGTPCSTLLPSANRTFRSPTMETRNSCTFREFVSVKKAVHGDGTKDILNLEMTDALQEKPLQNEKRMETEKPENFGALSSNDMQATQEYPRHVPVHVLNASLGMNTRSVSLDMPSQVEEIHHGHHPNPYFSYAAATNTQHVDASSSSSSLSPPYPIFDPFRSNQDNYQAYLQASSAFSGLIVSTLLQNPAAHAAASFAASFWPFANMEACGNNEKSNTFASSSLSSPPPSMAAIAAATVAAATAWWAAHGLLPYCSTPPPPPHHPLHNGFNSNPAIVSAITNLADKRENELSSQNQQQQHLETDCSEAPQAQQQSALKLPSERSEDAEQNDAAAAAANNNGKATTPSAAANDGKATTPSAAADPNKAKSVKLMDRSSCGSNTPSSSEVETDALEKHAMENAKEEEEFKEDQPDDADTSNLPCDSNTRRGGRISTSTSDSWKEVSQEGRLAFRALFSRGVLPQSFSPPNDMNNKGNEKSMNIENKNEEVVEDASELDLNRKTTENYAHPSSERVVQWTTDIGLGKLKGGSRRTGFKPYKRCSVEAKESLFNQGEESGSKRIRLDGEPSTL